MMRPKSVRGPVIAMLPMRNGQEERKRKRVMAAVLAALTLAFAVPASAVELAPQTKFRLTVVQWIPAKGEYMKWDAISGDFVVSDAGTVSLPLVGSIDVSGREGAALAAEVGKRLKDKLGLLTLPDASVEVVEYPPVYVVGSVMTPGSFAFRPGLTVLQALALGGGAYRAGINKGSQDQISLVGELKGVRDDILRGVGRLARLEAEKSGAKSAKDIQFPAELTTSSDKKLSAEIVDQEKLIFTTRADGLARQLATLTDLRDLFAAEIDVLQQKADTLDKSLQSMQKELSAVETLVNRGVATVSRRSDLERAVAAMQSDRLDQATATMRARQNMNEAVRNALSLRDERQTSIASDLQETESNLERMRSRREVVERLIVATSVNEDALRAEADAPVLRFSIVRRTKDRYDEIAASESTPLQPGDVLKVDAARPSDRVSRANGPTPEAAASEPAGAAAPASDDRAKLRAQVGPAVRPHVD